MPRESGHDRLYVGDRHTRVTPVEPLQPVRAGRPRVAFEPAPRAQARAVQRLMLGSYVPQDAAVVRAFATTGIVDAPAPIRACVFSAAT